MGLIFIGEGVLDSFVTHHSDGIGVPIVLVMFEQPLQLFWELVCFG